ncbi:hypothetical protein AB0O86_30610 [Streptomyces hirsutus]|uniref:hypothetical protein n=1 Tax=Streptomyces hirsutus TaxID=35620 RepID=UPI0034476F12
MRAAALLVRRERGLVWAAVRAGLAGLAGLAGRRWRAIPLTLTALCLITQG